MRKTTEKAKTKLITVAAQIAQNSVAPSNGWGWPPNCMGIIYQPKRPKRLKKTD